MKVHKIRIETQTHAGAPVRIVELTDAVMAFGIDAEIREKVVSATFEGIVGVREYEVTGAQTVTLHATGTRTDERTGAP